MNILTLDFETYFDDDYSLSKMTTEAYIRDPRFVPHGVGLRLPDGSQIWCAGPERGSSGAFAAFDWDDTTVLCHHAAFDGLILSHHYGVVPARWLDTYSMAQFLFGAEQSKSLGALAARFGLAEKSVPYDKVKGVHYVYMDRETQRELADGCLHDCELTYRIFMEMMKEFPECELPIVDLTIRLFTEPRLEGDIPLLRKIHNEEILSTNERLYNLEVGERDLASAERFAEILRGEGVEVAYKPGKLKPIPAVAKTDSFMQELLNEPGRIGELAQARLDVKSTITATRSARLGQMAERGRLCVYLHYCGAHTRRWSGGDDVNFQNLGRRSELRRAVVAPPGYVLAAPDQSQGEARILNWLAGQDDATERFRSGSDPYLPMASLLYGETITDPKDPRRQVGKVVELACGFGMGPDRLAATMRQSGLPFDEGFPALAVKAYRASHPKVVALWKLGDLTLQALGNRDHMKWGRLLEAVNGRLYHPNGTWLDYSSLKWEEGEWRLYGRAGSWRKMYGAKLIENIVQWLSRIVTAEAMVKFDRQGYAVVGMAHDDVWLLVPETEFGNAHSQFRIITIMSETPEWAPGLPLAAECKMGKTYGG